MNIEQIKQEKGQIEGLIRKLILDFAKKTELSFEKIEITKPSADDLDVKLTMRLPN